MHITIFITIQCRQHGKIIMEDSSSCDCILWKDGELIDLVDIFVIHSRKIQRNILKSSIQATAQKSMCTIYAGCFKGQVKTDMGLGMWTMKINRSDLSKNLQKYLRVFVELLLHFCFICSNQVNTLYIITREVWTMSRLIVLPNVISDAMNQYVLIIA